jgi:arylsulfatase A-like enzyme
VTINRRDFLKFSALLTASTFMQPSLILFPTQLSPDPNAKNVLIILFDTLTASNISFHGYRRETMPNLTRLLDRATVYHNHYASSNFTTPGTASLLTGRHVWDHHAIKLSDEVRSELANFNIFTLFDDYFKQAFTHNHFADIFLTQFSEAISQHQAYKELFLEYQLAKSSPWFDLLMRNDPDTGLLFKKLLADSSISGYLYSLLFPSLLGQDEYQPPAKIAAHFPRGVPEADGRGPFILEDAIDWIIQQSTSLPQPFLGYYHLLPPHSPYNTREEYVDFFLDDGYQPPEKPPHPVVIPNTIITIEEELQNRRHYDEFLLYVDYEFNRLFTYLEQLGVLENTLLLLTSDHGELFERRMKEHNDPYLFEPATKIPLIFFEPGQTERKDIHTLTSCIDVLPTLLHYTNHKIPSSLPGDILPPFAEPSAKQNKRVFAMDARLNREYSHITTATLMMRKANMKVIRYSDYADNYRYYGHQDKLNTMQIKSEIYYEVYNLENDPDELINLALDPSAESQALIDELEQFYRQNVEYPH